MKTILVLSPDPGFAEALRKAVNAETYRVVHRVQPQEAEPLLVHGLAQVCVVDTDLSGVEGVWVLEKLQRYQPRCPILIYTEARQPAWEEEAYRKGATHVLNKPLQPKILELLLERLLGGGARFPAEEPRPAAATVTAPTGSDTTRFFPAQVQPSPVQATELLRDFSAILTHSLDSTGLLRQFLLLLRRLVSLNRAVIFLRSPEAALRASLAAEEDRRLRAAASLGLGGSLLENVELSLDSGIGAQLRRLGRILRRGSEEARNDLETQKEFELLGAQVAVPILDREGLIGVAVFDSRVTGEPLVNAELELIFHLLEQVGLALRNIWLHEQLAANNEMMSGVLRELSHGCVVVSRDLKVLHANKMARKYFAPGARGGELEFADLPQALATKIYQVVRSGAALEPFRYEPPESPQTIYQVAIVPFGSAKNTPPVPVLMLVEDRTQAEQLRRLEIESANLRLLKTMADRLAHEVGNAMVPLSTHQQLLPEKYRDPEFRASLSHAMEDSVKRVMRLINQMRFLARDALATRECFPLGPLIEEAFQEARKHQQVSGGQLHCESPAEAVLVTGDRAALKYALTEVLINALQANPNDPKIGVRIQTGTGGETNGLRIEVQDNGEGFSPEALKRASDPFFTTRNVGLGLGLAVTRKIVETHHGKLEIVPPKTGRAGIVRIVLPSEATKPSLS
jgi:signal transduction histidine kinase/DNA-binding NarL/FixJ family response regulator